VEPKFVSAGEIRVDGLRSPYIQAGDPGSREAVVFVHGNPGSHLDWYELLTRTGSFARAVAFDAPGFGGADKPADFDYSVPGYARFIGGALRELGIERPIWSCTTSAARGDSRGPPAIRTHSRPS
jgi:pimeloyl-ACP methyl ester carboxylesterase